MESCTSSLSNASSSAAFLIRLSLRYPVDFEDLLHLIQWRLLIEDFKFVSRVQVSWERVGFRSEPLPRRFANHELLLYPILLLFVILKLSSDLLPAIYFLRLSTPPAILSFCFSRFERRSNIRLSDSGICSRFLHLLPLRRTIGVLAALFRFGPRLGVEISEELFRISGNFLTKIVFTAPFVVPKSSLKASENVRLALFSDSCDDKIFIFLQTVLERRNILCSAFSPHQTH